MEGPDLRHDERRRAHEAVAARLHACSDAELLAMIGAAGQANSHGNQSAVLELAGANVFAKSIALCDLERTPANEGSTANLFDLPLVYHYPVGSAGFGAWRELAAALKASEWALAGECPYFPIVHHWRVLPRAGGPATEEQLRRVEELAAYWENAPAIRARLQAILAGSASIVLFLEWAPDMLHGWLLRQAVGGRLDVANAPAIERIDAQLHETAVFMRSRGLVHFDLFGNNVLTDGEQIYAADFGLALAADFDLDADERAFFEAHRAFGLASADAAVVGWLTAPPDNPPALPPAVQALVDRRMPAAMALYRFFQTLRKASKQTPYPAAEIEAALAASPT